MRPTRDPASERVEANDARTTPAPGMRGAPTDMVADVTAWDQRLPAILVRLGLALVGASLIAAGALADGAALARWVGANLSPDGAISVPYHPYQILSVRVRG